jgi:hypothetical protein
MGTKCFVDCDGNVVKLKDLDPSQYVVVPQKGWTAVAVGCYHDDGTFEVKDTYQLHDELWYNYNGLCGCVQQRTCQASGTLISVFNNDQAELTDEDPEYPWVTVCEDHGSLCVHPTLALAKSHAAWPEWCEECQPNLQ